MNNNMKKFIVSMLALAVFAGHHNADAQDERGGGFNPGRMDERIAGMMVKEISLSDEQKDRFILDFKAYRQELREADPRVKKMMAKDPAEARKARRDQMRNLSDEELEARILSGFAAERAKVDVKEKYFAVFKEYLNAKQIDKVFNFNPMAQRSAPMGGAPGMGAPGGGFGGPGGF